MTTIVSATTRNLSRAPRKRLAFISRSSLLLRDSIAAYSEQRYADAVEFSYQAALRAAGAVVVASPVAARKRLPKGAWKQLSLVGKEEQSWANMFAQYSTMRSRLISGLDREVDPVVAAELIRHVEDFLDFVERGDMGEALAA